MNPVLWMDYFQPLLNFTRLQILFQEFWFSLYVPNSQIDNLHFHILCVHMIKNFTFIYCVHMIKNLTHEFTKKKQLTMSIYT
jgi:hypothetical protein